VTTIACVLCDNHHFEIRSLEFPGSTLTVSVVQCSRCHFTIGMLGEHDVARKLASIEQNVMTIAAILGHMATGITTQIPAPAFAE
jgi:hypothetical protein